MLAFEPHAGASILSVGEHQRHVASAHGTTRDVHRLRAGDDTTDFVSDGDESDDFSEDESVVHFSTEKGWIGPVPCIVKNITCTATIKVRLDDESRKKIWASFRHAIPFGWGMNASECVFQIAFASEQKKIANERLKSDKKRKVMVHINCETLYQGKTCWALGVVLPAYAPRTHERPATILVAQADVCDTRELLDPPAYWTSDNSARRDQFGWRPRWAFLPESEQLALCGQVISYDILQRSITGRDAGPPAKLVEVTRAI